MTDAYVIGTTLPALAAALELAEVGLSVRIALDESAPAPASAPAFEELNHGGELDPDAHIAALLKHLAEPIGDRATGYPDARPVAHQPRPVQLRDVKGGWALQPMPSVWGIPAVPMAKPALEILGGSGAARASLDRVKPVLTIGKTHEFGVLVRNRMGRTVEQRLIAPFVRERYGVAPDEIEAGLAAPGLNEALTRAGSLSGAALAYSERYVARETRVAPSAGWPALAAVLIERLKLYGAQFSEAPVDAVTPDASSRPGHDGWRIRELDGQEVAVRALVVDTGAPMPGALGATLATLAPEGWRTRARVQLADPGLSDQQHDALQALELDEAGIWSVRISRDSNSQWWAQLAGPRRTGAVHDQDRARMDQEAASVRAVLDLAGLQTLSELETAIHVAPYISTAQREAAATQLLEQRESAPALLPVGIELHGGDLSAAVGDSRHAAITLRRRLTGIAE